MNNQLSNMDDMGRLISAFILKKRIDGGEK